MNILIELPTWLGDCIMTTPAINNIIKTYPNASITLFGSFVSTQALKTYPNVKNIIVDESKNSKYRLLWLYKSAKKLEKFDLAISFRKSFATKFFLFFLDAKNKYFYKKTSLTLSHQVIYYNDYINKILNTSNTPSDLKLFYTPFKFEKPTLGLNPGATYGSAKRWYPNEFAKVAISLSHMYDIVIFGSKGEVDIANDIENKIRASNITNVVNYAGKTTISELIEKIAGLDLFITNDSGPMHIAAAFKIKTITIFGPTKYIETSQWNNINSYIISKNLECSPCMKKVCPIKTHDCMKLITSNDVLKVVDENITNIH